MKNRLFLIVLFVVVAAVPFWDRSRANLSESKKAASKNGGLTLVAQYEALHLEIYADISSTNRCRTFEIIEQGKPIYRREIVSPNKIEDYYLERTMDLLTDYDSNGVVRERFLHTFFTNNLDRMKYAYVDTNGDGTFDFLLQYDESGVQTAAFKLTN